MSLLTERFAAPVVLAMLLTFAGCTNQPAAKPQGAISQQGATAAQDAPRVIDMTRGPKNSGQYFDVDSCADRLHSIEGQIILYYAAHRELPQRLSDLARYADVGEVADYTCPVSHQSYVYVPTGLALANDPTRGRLILYDATPAHDSARGPMRWGILFSEAKGREPPMTQVIPIPESTMPGFVPLTPRQPATPSVPAAQAPHP